MLLSPRQFRAEPKATTLTTQQTNAGKCWSVAWLKYYSCKARQSRCVEWSKSTAGEKNQAARGEAMSGLLGEVLREEGKAFVILSETLLSREGPGRAARRVAL